MKSLLIFTTILLLISSASAQCSCTSCICDGNTCPVSVPVGSPLTVEISCNGNCDGHFNSASTDGSSFQVYAYDDANYASYSSGGSASYFTALSSSTDVTCFDSGTASVNTNTLYIVFSCQNLVQNCPIQYDTFFVASPAPAPAPAPTPSSGSGSCTACDNACQSSCYSSCGGAATYSCSDTSGILSVTCDCTQTSQTSSHTASSSTLTVGFLFFLALISLLILG